jgi:fatty-acyl-CoA synthase
LTTSAGHGEGWLPGYGPGSVIVRGRIEGSREILAIERQSPESVLAGSTAYECLLTAARLYPDKPAIIALAGGGSTEVAAALNYSQYVARSTAAANLFREAASGQRSVVALMLPILPEALVAAWGAAAAGVVNPINPYLEPSLVISILNSVRATVLVTTQAYGRSAADRLDEIVAAVPTLRRVLLVGGNQPQREFARAIADQRSDCLTFTPVTEWSAEAMFLPTGGTTAAPKLARLTHGGMALSAWIAGAIMGSAPDEVIGLGMPLFHVGGMLSLGLRSAVLGQTVLLYSPAGFRDRGVVANFWEIARVHGITSLIATPTTAAALYAGGDDEHRGHAIRTFTSGGSTIPLELGRLFPLRFGIELREVWGSTEFHGFLGCQPNRVAPLIGSVGLRTPWHRIKAVELDQENGFVREMPTGKQGVIIGTGPCLALGYVDPALDREFFVKRSPDGQVWGSSGDLGRIDANGYVWIDGRAKDVIIRGGHNIDPGLIEEVLTSREEILYAAAVGLPDRDKGELPIAFVECIPGARIDCDALLAHCRATIPERAACPVRIIVLEQMPLTAVGKIFRPALRELALRKAAAEVLEQTLGAGTARIDTNLVGGRPEVVIHIHDADPGTQEKLRVAFAGFAFNTRISVASDRPAPEAIAAP